MTLLDDDRRGPHEPDDEVARLRVPPQSVEAEQSIIGGLLLDNRAWDLAAALLSESDFYRHDHRLIFATIGGLIGADKPADVITVFERLQAAGSADDCGGLAYLNALAQSVPSAANMRRYAEIVRERSVLRSVIGECDAIASEAFGRGDVRALVDRIAAFASSLERRQVRRVPSLIGDLVAARIEQYERLQRGEEKPGISTGFDRVDDKLSGGLRAGLYILAARPSVGKSSLAQQIALHIAANTGPALFLSQEMSRSRVANRAISRIGKIRMSALLNGQLSEAEWSQLAEASDTLRGLPFHVDDEPALRIGQIRAKARAIKGIKLLVVDYLQLCGSDLRGENRNNQIEEISRGLKALSTELDVPVLALSQLNREVERRASKRPSMADLRDSGAIEQDADVVLFLWPVREFKDQGRKILGLAIDKNRDGELGEMALELYGAHQHWYQSDADIAPPRAAAAEGGFS